MALSKTTQDHDEIRQWAEARGAQPAEVASTERDGQTGIIRLEFPKAPHANDSALKEISWEEFFEKFDASGLAFTYQEKTADGEQSNFNKLTYPENTKPSSVSTSSHKTSSHSTSSHGSASHGSSSPGSGKKPAASSGDHEAKRPPSAKKSRRA